MKNSPCDPFKYYPVTVGVYCVFLIINTFDYLIYLATHSITSGSGWAIGLLILTLMGGAYATLLLGGSLSFIVESSKLRSRTENIVKFAFDWRAITLIVLSVPALAFHLSLYLDLNPEVKYAIGNSMKALQ